MFLKIWFTTNSQYQQKDLGQSAIEMLKVLRDRLLVLVLLWDSLTVKNILTPTLSLKEHSCLWNQAIIKTRNSKKLCQRAVMKKSKVNVAFFSILIGRELWVIPWWEVGSPYTSLCLCSLSACVRSCCCAAVVDYSWVSIQLRAVERCHI